MSKCKCNKQRKEARGCKVCKPNNWQEEEISLSRAVSPEPNKSAFSPTQASPPRPPPVSPEGPRPTVAQPQASLFQSAMTVVRSSMGRGKGGKGLGKGGCKRHRRYLRDNIQGITKPAIRRLARRGGVKRLSGLVYDEVRGVLRVFLEETISDAVTYSDHARRKTVTAQDVLYALKRRGRQLYF
jgi:histone H4